MGIGFRIKQARENLGLTQTELGKKIGVTGSAITNYENNVSHPKEPILYKLIEVLEVSPNFLFQDEISIKEEQLHIIDKNEKKLINNYRLLPEKGKKYILQTVEMAVNTYTMPREVAAWGAKGTKGTYKTPKREIT